MPFDPAIGRYLTPEEQAQRMHDAALGLDAVDPEYASMLHMREAPVPFSGAVSDPVPERAPMLDANGTRGSYLDRLAIALQGVQQPQATGRAGDDFAASLLSGLGRGFSASHMSGMKRRTEIQDALNQSAHDRNVANIEATRKSNDWMMARRGHAQDAEADEAAKAKYRKPDAEKAPAVTVPASSLGVPWLKALGNTPLTPAEAASALKPTAAERDAANGTVDAFGANPITPERLAAAGMTPEALDLAARKYALFGDLGTWGMGKNPIRPMIVTRASQLWPDIIPGALKGEYNAQQQALATIQKQATTQLATERMTLDNAKVLERTLKAVPDTKVPWLNHLVRPAMEGALGSTEVAQFNTALETLRPEFGKILGGTTGSSVGLSDSQKRDMKAVLSGDFTVRQLRASLAVLKRDAYNRRVNNQRTVKEAQDALNNVLPAPGTKTRPSLDSIFGGP